MNKRIFATAAFTGLLALAPAFAQNQGGTAAADTAGAPRNTKSDETQKMDKKGSMGQLSSKDHKFVMDAAADGMMEVELGRLAAQKASNADVKAFAQRMVTDHSKANQRLMQVASQSGVTLPTTLPADKRKEVDQMTRLSGAEFDRMYMGHMVKAHKKDVAEFEKQASKSDNSSVQSFARETLPTLREHYQMSQTIATKVGAPMDHSDHNMGKSGKQ
jgi:putative membrane protein